MVTNAHLQARSSTQFLIGSGLLLALLITLSRWAGVPEQGRGYFIMGVVSLVVVTGVFAYLSWLLLLRPLPGLKVRARPVAASTRRTLAALIAMSGITLTVGAFWDEVWHRTYGLPFGEDLFWPPHQLIYSSLLIIIGLAAWSAYRLWRGEGNLTERFRANPLLGLLALMGGLFLYMLPADPLWHTLYGEDITAWSLPHLLLLVAFSVAMLMAAALQRSAERPSAWSAPKLTVGTLLIVIVSAFLLLFNPQVLLTEWDTDFTFLVSQRPAWMLPALLVGLSSFVGVFALQATRFVGAATAAGVLALGLRAVMLSVFPAAGMSADPWLAMLPPLVALDVLYAVYARRDTAPAWGIAGLVAGAGMSLVGLPLVDRLFAYPDLSAATAPGMVIATFVAAVLAVWLGRTVAEGIVAGYQAEPQQSSSAQRPLRFVPPLALTVVVAFTLLIIVTATPPS